MSSKMCLLDTIIIKKCEVKFMITLEQIQHRLAEAIKQSGMTQNQIAEKIGVNRSQISCYLTARKMPALDTLANLCKVLDVDTNYILCQDIK